MISTICTFTPAWRLPLLTRSTVSLVHNVAIIIFFLALGKLEGHHKGHIGSHQCWAVSHQFGCHLSSCKNQNWSSLHLSEQQLPSTVHYLHCEHLLGCSIISKGICTPKSLEFSSKPQFRTKGVPPNITYRSVIHFLPRAKRDFLLMRLIYSKGEYFYFSPIFRTWLSPGDSEQALHRSC